MGPHTWSMADVGELKIRLTFDSKALSTSQKSVESKMSGMGGNSGRLFSNAWTLTLGNLLSKGVDKVISSISSAMDKGIARVDTLNNFPKVMTNLGYASDEAEKSIKTVADRLDGLPSTTDDVVSGVQMLAATMGNLNKGTVSATSVGLAFNDMILAGSGDTDAAKNALVQYNQMLAAGKVDMQSWQSITNVASGQMNQLAQSILGTNANSQQLYEAMKNGKVSFEDLNAAIVKLDSEGIDGFASFEEQARDATDGIGTALENVQNRIGKAIAKIIEHIGEEKIADVINTISSSFSGIADIVINVIDFLAENQWIVEFIGIAAATVGILAAAIWVMNAAVMANPITWIILAIGLVVAAIAMLVLHFQEVADFVGNLFAPIGEFFTWIWESITSFFSAAGEIIGGVAQWIWDHTLGPIVDFVKNVVILIVAIVATIVQAIWNVVSPIVDWVYTTIIQPIADFVTGLWDGIVDGVTGFIEKVKEVFGTIANWVNEHVVQPIARFFEGLWNGITTAIEAVKTTFQNIFDTIANIIKTPINAIINGINGVLSAINSITVPDWVPVIGGAHPDFGMIPTLAQGGYANGATAAIFGEAGKEAVLPLERNTDNWSGLLARTLADEMEQQELGAGGGVTIEHMNFEIDNELDARDIGRVMMQSIRRAA